MSPENIAQLEAALKEAGGNQTMATRAQTRSFIGLACCSADWSNEGNCI